MVGEATAMEEFKALVREALDEHDDVRASIEYDEEFSSPARSFSE